MSKGTKGRSGRIGRQKGQLMRLILAAIAAALIFALAGCGSTRTETVTAAQSSSSVTSSTTSQGMSKAQAATTYLADIAPATPAAASFKQAVTNSSTGPEIAQAAQPLISALQSIALKLDALAQQYPAAAADLKTLVSGESQVTADLQNAKTVTAFDAVAWEQQTMSDLAATRADSNIVRSDLGLPQHKG